MAQLFFVAAKKNVDSEKPGLSRVVRRTCIKRQSVCAQRCIKYSSEDDQVLASFGVFFFLATFLGRFTSDVRHVCDKLPSEVKQSKFVTLKLKKSPVNRLKIRACLKSRRFYGDQSPRNRR